MENNIENKLAASMVILLYSYIISVAGVLIGSIIEWGINSFTLITDGEQFRMMWSAIILGVVIYKSIKIWKDFTTPTP